MATRKLAVLAAVLITAFTAQESVRAQQPLIGVDGCAILATLVYTEISDAGMFHSSGLAGMLTYLGRDEVTICNRAAQTVSGAFASSLRQMNIYISWGAGHRGSGDYCLSHYLSQCYPRGNPNMPALSVRDRLFVSHTWRAVFATVSGRVGVMPGGDVVRFKADDLRRDLRSSIAVDQRAPAPHLTTDY